MTKHENHTTYVSPKTNVDKDVYYHDGNKEAGYNLSWGSVFAGIITFIALLITFSLINAALGFGQFDPTNPNPFDGVGTGQAIWTAVSLILSFLGAGFVAGLTSRRMGFVHGFLTWAGSLLSLVLLVSWLVSTALSAVGTVASGAASVAGDAISSVASTAGDAVSEGINTVAENINVSQQDIDELNETVTSVLEDTDIPELQPEYLSNQVDEAKTEISNAAQEVIVNPNNVDQIVQDLAASLTARVENIAESLDEQAVANAVESNTELTQAEAEKATQNVIDGYNQAAESLRTGIQSAADALDTVTTEVSQTVDQITTEVADTANEVTNTASAGSVWAFVAVVLGAVIAALGGSLGVNTATRWINEQRA